VEQSGPIHELKKPEDIRAEPLGLPAGFEWSTMDVNDDAQVRFTASLSLLGLQFTQM
jgi:hypothetical protein